jgi:tRNA threonylcarbamoyladenosine modification (KEOPS) complex  Pcc1 subunit
MSNTDIFAKLHDNTLKATVADSIYDQIVVSLTAGTDTINLYVSKEDIEHLFGALNNYLEVKWLNA